MRRLSALIALPLVLGLTACPERPGVKKDDKKEADKKKDDKKTDAKVAPAKKAD